MSYPCEKEFNNGTNGSEMDIEERINLWLNCRGVRPESPSKKKHDYYECNRRKFFFSNPQ